MGMQLHRYKISLFTRKRNRVVLLTPTLEFEEKKIVWKLNTYIYSLSDA